jgi:hypothetical protein
MLADLPPSSRQTRLTVSAASMATRRPTAVEPVKDTTSTPGWVHSTSPTSAPGPGTMFSTPGGIPMSSAASARTNADRGVSAAGLATTVHPAASAGATFATNW